MKNKEGLRRILTLFLASLVVILWVLSISVLALSTIIRDEFSKIALVTENTSAGNFYLNLFFPVVFPVLISVSCFFFVIGCLGCCGAFTESQILLGWFFFSILVTFFVELSAGIWRMLSTDLSYSDNDLQQLKFNIEKYAGKPSFFWFKNAWNDVQHKFQCCGVYDYNDWVNEDPLMLSSCCSNGLIDEVCLNELPEIIGCGKPMLDFLGSTQLIPSTAYVTVVMGVIQFLVMVLTLKLWLMFCFTQRPKNFGDPYFYSLNRQQNENQYENQEKKLIQNQKSDLKEVAYCSDSNFHVIEIEKEKQFSDHQNETKFVQFDPNPVTVHKKNRHSSGSSRTDKRHKNRQHPYPVVDKGHGFCELCSALHNQSNEQRQKLIPVKRDVSRSGKSDLSDITGNNSKVNDQNSMLESQPNLNLPDSTEKRDTNINTTPYVLKQQE